MATTMNVDNDNNLALRVVSQYHVMAGLSLRRSPVNPPLFDCRMKRASLTPAYLPWPVIVIESKNPQTHPRSIKCQQWPSGRAAADRDRARGLNLLTADSTTNSPVLSLATDNRRFKASDFNVLLLCGGCREDGAQKLEFSFFFNLRRSIEAWAGRHLRWQRQ